MLRLPLLDFSLSSPCLQPQWLCNNALRQWRQRANTHRDVTAGRLNKCILFHFWQGIIKRRHTLFFVVYIVYTFLVTCILFYNIKNQNVWWLKEVLECEMRKQYLDLAISIFTFHVRKTLWALPLASSEQSSGPWVLSNQLTFTWSFKVLIDSSEACSDLFICFKYGCASDFQHNTVHSLWWQESVELF